MITAPNIPQVIIKMTKEMTIKEMEKVMIKIKTKIKKKIVSNVIKGITLRKTKSAKNYLIIVSL